MVEDFSDIEFARVFAFREIELNGQLFFQHFEALETAPYLAPYLVLTHEQHNLLLSQD